MARRNLQRIEEIKTLPNVFSRNAIIKGKWNKEYFKNNHPIILELACGKGEYTIELAQRFLEKNFIGVDIRGARLWKGAKLALELNLKNVAFLNELIQHIARYFDEDEVAEIWLTFPDPYPKRRDEKHRLTTPAFLKLYQKILKNGGMIRLKTDDQTLFEYTKESLQKENGIIQEAIEDLNDAPVKNEILTIQTTYERKYLAMGRKIFYLCFSF